MLDSISVHAKMSLVHSMVQYILKHITHETTLALAPSLVETYCRILVYTEVESLAVKGFINQVLPTVFKHEAWGVLHVILEVFSHRLHHVQANFRLSLLSHLQVGIGGNAGQNMLTRNCQLAQCVETTALRLIVGLSNSEANPPRGHPTPPGGVGAAAAAASKGAVVMYGDSEELNRCVVMTLARAVHINGVEQGGGAAWIKETLTAIMQKTPHAWPSHTLDTFPHIIREFYHENPGPKDNRAAIKQATEEHYKILMNMMSGTADPEERIVGFFFGNGNSNTTFLCAAWKEILDKGAVPAIVAKIVRRVGPKQMQPHLRSLCDLIVSEFGVSKGGGQVNKMIDAVNNMIWREAVTTLDRFVLTLALKCYEGNEAQICFFIIQLLLLKPADLRSRVSELVASTPPPALAEGLAFHEAHVAFHEKFPEKFAPSGVGEGERDPNSVCLPVSNNYPKPLLRNALFAGYRSTYSFDCS